MQQIEGYKCGLKILLKWTIRLRGIVNKFQYDTKKNTKIKQKKI